jgi:hypothetical protein
LVCSDGQISLKLNSDGVTFQDSSSQNLPEPPDGAFAEEIVATASAFWSLTTSSELYAFAKCVFEFPIHQAAKAWWVALGDVRKACPHGSSKSDTMHG